MRFRGVLLTIVVVLGLVLAVFNWDALAAPVPFDFLFTRLELPLGLTMLVFVVVLASLFFLGALFDRASQLRQVTQLERQLDALRGKLEACRQAEVGQLEQALAEGFQDLNKRLDTALAAPAAAPTSVAPEPGDEAMAEHLEGMEARILERLAAVEMRVSVVRDELAADIGQSEDAMKRWMVEEPEPPE